MRRLLVLLALLLLVPAAHAVAQEPAHDAPAAGTPPAAAPEPPPPPPRPMRGVLQVGISEQQAAVFADPGFQRLGLRYARLVVPWNVALRRGPAQDRARDWLTAAQAAGIQPHVAFNTEKAGSRYADRRPSLARYRTAFRAFRRMFPAVRVFTPWNEANHRFQPTAKRPWLAARYYAIMKAVCRRCTVLGADVLDQPGLDRWMARFRRGLHGRDPRIWGLHNYQDANHHIAASRSWTVRFPRLVRGQIWATETGGIVAFMGETGRLAYPFSPSRAARSMRHLFSLMRRRDIRDRYTRVYIYNWYGVRKIRRRAQRWDSGLVSYDGRPRPALKIVRRQVRISAAQQDAAARRAARR